MSEPKTFASLSPSLLARKGAARPAMRPQLQPLHQNHDSLARQAVEDDLGWNDMGHDHVEAPAEAPVVQAVTPEAPVAPAPVPEVVRQQEAIIERIAAAPAPAPVAAPASARPERAQPGRRSALNDGRRAAFTLRVDADRHLKLRLACTLRGRSAQQIVTEALDMLIDSLPEVSSLAAQVAAKR